MELMICSHDMNFMDNNINIFWFSNSKDRLIIISFEIENK